MKLIALGAFALAALTAGTASAQSQPQTPPLTHGPVVAGVCIFSQQALISSSTAGQSLGVGLQRLDQEVVGELAPYETSIQAEAQALEQGGASIPAADRQQREGALAQRYQDYQRLRQQRQNELRYTQMLQTEVISNAARPIIQGLYQERGCSVLLDGSTILAANPAMDITPMAVQRLNQALPSLPAFNRSPVPAELQQ